MTSLSNSYHYTTDVFKLWVIKTNYFLLIDTHSWNHFNPPYIFGSNSKIRTEKLYLISHQANSMNNKNNAYFHILLLSIPQTGNGLSFQMLCGEYGLRKALKISYAYRCVQPFCVQKTYKDDKQWLKMKEKSPTIKWGF